MQKKLIANRKEFKAAIFSIGYVNNSINTYI